MKAVHRFCFALVLFCLSCSSNPYSEKGTISVGIEAGQGYVVENPFVDIVPGQNAVFKITLDEDYSITGCSYWKSKIEPTSDGCRLTLLSVQYPTIARLSVSSSNVIIEGPASSKPDVSSSDSSTSGQGSEWTDPEGAPIDDASPDASPFDQARTSIKVSKEGPHIRAHAPNGLKYFNYSGYLQVGWNTKQDLSGEFIGFGWRYDKSYATLYGEFVKVSDESLFEFEEGSKSCRIVGYHGEETSLVIPRYHNGKKVTVISEGAIVSDKIEELVLPPNLRKIEKEGVLCGNLKKITFYDNLYHISGNSIVCPNLETVRLNAVESPAYAGSFWDGFQDKIDYLDKIKDKKKIVLFSGSSTRYGFFSPAIHEAYPDYEVVNMGVFAYFGIFQQLEIIGTYLNEGDILILAPEFDAMEQQFCLKRAFDHRFFFCLESGFQELARMDLRRISGFFEGFATFQELRSHCPRGTYDDFAYQFDDEDHYYETPIYNENGDMTLYRPNTDFSGQISQPLLDYSISALFGSAPNAAETLNDFYHEFEERYGARVFFTYAPKNIYCLTPNSDFSVRFELDNYLRERIDAPMLGGIEDSLFETRYFYMIDNHLSTEGAELRTAYVIGWLSEFI